MGVKYSDLNYEASRERSTMIPGRVYKVCSDVRDNNTRLKKGDLLLCLFKEGDCFYRLVRIVLRTSNSKVGYFGLCEFVNSYTLEEAFPKMRTFSESDLVHILTKKECIITLEHTYSEEKLKLIKLKENLELNLSEINLKLTTMK